MKKSIGLGLATLLLLLQAVLSTGCALGVSADAGRPPYSFAIETIMDDAQLRGSGTMILSKRDIHVPHGVPLTVHGWLATDEGVSAYESLWVPAGGGVAEWTRIKDASIFSRFDLQAVGIPYASGHGTAGFHVTIPAPADVTDGYYDVYLRAIDGTGSPCDILVMPGLRYGNADYDDGQTVRVNFDRVAAQKADALRGATVDASGITLSPDGRIRLGDYRLGGFAQARVTYRTSASAADDGRRPILGLKSDGDDSFGTPGEAYNMTDVLAYTAVNRSADREMEAVLDLTEITHMGDVWLTAYTGESITVTSIEFIGNGYVSDRVAAKIHFSCGMPGGYFAGANRVSLNGVTDPTLGEVLRVEVTEDTNDPYVHFYADRALEDAGIRLSADEYKYMVVLARAMPDNLRDHMTFYLCAGSITGATEACTFSAKLVRDGKWHYYLFDLTRLENWRGIIHGWRFDIISGDSVVGNAVEYATVQFFRTPEAASAASKQNPASEKPHLAGDPIVELDMSEENNAEDAFVIDPADTYIVTEPESEPLATESEPLATESEPLATESESLTTDSEPLATESEPLATDSESLATESEPEGAGSAPTPSEGGCTSLVGAGMVTSALTVCATLTVCAAMAAVTGRLQKRNR